MDVSIIIVSWNVRDLLRQCLRSIRIQNTHLPWRAVPGEYRVQKTADSRQQAAGGADGRELSAEMWVVDNASADGTLAMLRDEFPDVHVIANLENAGFSRGNNQALAQAQGRYLFLLNPDTELCPGTLGALVDYMDAHPDVGVVGPRLFYGGGSPQSSRRRFPTLATAFCESTKLQQWFPRNRVLAHYYMLDTPNDAEQEVDWLNGSALLVRREVYEQLGGFDEAFFMYSEELDWCYRIKQSGWRIIYLPSARVIHYEAQSSDQVVAQRDINFHSSKIRFFRKYHGAWAAALLRAFLLLMFAFQIAEEGCKWLLGHKRALRAARVKGYWQVLKSGLR